MFTQLSNCKVLNVYFIKSNDTATQFSTIGKDQLISLLLLLLLLKKIVPTEKPLPRLLFSKNKIITSLLIKYIVNRGNGFETRQSSSWYVFVLLFALTIRKTQ